MKKTISRDVFRETMENLCKFYKEPFDKFTDMIYWGTLRDLTEEEFNQAIVNIFKTRVYPTMPQPGEIRQMAIGKNRHIIAADNLMFAVRSYGGNYSVVFDDPILHVIIDKHFSSWIKFCKMSSEEQQKFIKFDFEALYKAYSEQKHIEIKTKLLGCFDAQNESSEDYDALRYVKYVGEEKKALEWIDAYENRKKINKIGGEVVALAEKKAV